MHYGLDHLNAKRQAQNSVWLNDFCDALVYDAVMAEPMHDWYLREWLRTLGKKQADIARDLDWNKARVSLMIRGEQQYTRDAINEIAAYLSVKPHELLMHPDDAMTLRRLRADMLRLAHSADSEAESKSLKKSFV